MPSCHLPRHFKNQKVQEKILKMSFFGYNLVQDYEMEDDETDTYIDPRFRTVEPWSNEAIETWKYDRKRKYPTFTKLESAKRVKQALEEKRRRMREARANQMKERQNTEHQGKRKFRNRHDRRGNANRRKGNHKNSKNNQREGYCFPDFDYEEEGVKDGIVMFPGTTQILNETVEEEEVDIPISDDDDENYDALNDTLSTSENEIVENLPSVSSNPQSDQCIAKTQNAEKWATFEIDDDDDVPEVQAVKIRKDDASEMPLHENTDKKANEAKTVKKPEKSYAQILWRPKRPTTLLETLLESEITREKYELLQCINFVVSNGFFGVAENKNDEN